MQVGGIAWEKGKWSHPLASSMCEHCASPKDGGVGLRLEFETM